MNQMDQFGNQIRSLLQNQGVNHNAEQQTMDVIEFANANGEPNDGNREQYGLALADFLRNRGHQVTVNP